MRYLLIFLFSFLYAQDSTGIQLRINKQIELAELIQKQIIQGQVDLGKIEYSIWVLNDMLIPPKKEGENEKSIN